MGAVAMCNKVLELGGKGSATYWPPEKPVACLAPERSWPDFGVYKHETVRGTRVGCYVLLPPGNGTVSSLWASLHEHLQGCRRIGVEASLRRRYPSSFQNA